MQALIFGAYATAAVNAARNEKERRFLLDALFQYASSGNDIVTDEMPEWAWAMLRQEIDHLSEGRKRLADIGRKGGSAPSRKRKQAKSESASQGASTASEDSSTASQVSSKAKQEENKEEESKEEERESTAPAPAPVEHEIPEYETNLEARAPVATTSFPQLDDIRLACKQMKIPEDYAPTFAETCETRAYQYLKGNVLVEINGMNWKAVLRSFYDQDKRSGRLTIPNALQDDNYQFVMQEA